MAFSFKSFSGTCKIFGSEKFVELVPEFAENGKQSAMLAIHGMDADVAMKLIAAVSNPTEMNPAPIKQAEVAAVAKGDVKAELEEAREATKIETKAPRKERKKKTKKEETSSSEVPEEIKSSKKRRAIIDYVISTGASSVDEVVAKCHELQEQIPALQKDDMEEKIREAARIMKIGE